MPVLDIRSSLRFGGLGTGAKLEKDDVCWIVPGRFLIILTPHDHLFSFFR